MKKIIVLTGTANVGKSATLRRVEALLKERFPRLREIAVLRRTRIEIRVVVEIDEVRVGIDSRGDRAEHVEQALEALRREHCSIIVCASHTKGGTIEQVMQFANDHCYDVIPVSKTAATTEALQARADDLCAQDIVTRIEQLCSRKPPSA